jgi:hypothetical protein
MKEEEVQFEEIESSHTLGGTGKLIFERGPSELLLFISKRKSER